MQLFPWFLRREEEQVLPPKEEEEEELQQEEEGAADVSGNASQNDDTREGANKKGDEGSRNGWVVLTEEEKEEQEQQQQNKAQLLGGEEENDQKGELPVMSVPAPDAEGVTYKKNHKEEEKTQQPVETHPQPSSTSASTATTQNPPSNSCFPKNLEKIEFEVVRPARRSMMCSRDGIMAVVVGICCMSMLLSCLICYHQKISYEDELDRLRSNIKYLEVIKTSTVNAQKRRIDEAMLELEKCQKALSTRDLIVSPHHNNNNRNLMMFRKPGPFDTEDYHNGAGHQDQQQSDGIFKRNFNRFLRRERGDDVVLL